MLSHVEAVVKNCKGFERVVTSDAKNPDISTHRRAQPSSPAHAGPVRPCAPLPLPPDWKEEEAVVRRRRKKKDEKRRERKKRKRKKRRREKEKKKEEGGGEEGGGEGERGRKPR